MASEFSSFDLAIADLESYLGISWVGHHTIHSRSKRNIVWTHPFYATPAASIEGLHVQMKTLANDYTRIADEWFDPKYMRSSFAVKDESVPQFVAEKTFVEASACNLAISFGELDLLRRLSRTPEITTSFVIGMDGDDLYKGQFRVQEPLNLLKEALRAYPLWDARFLLSVDPKGRLQPRQGNYGIFDCDQIPSWVSVQMVSMQDSFTQTQPYHVGTNASRCVKHSGLSTAALGFTPVCWQPYCFEMKRYTPGAAINRKVQQLVSQLENPQVAQQVQELFVGGNGRHELMRIKKSVNFDQISLEIFERYNKRRIHRSLDL